MADFVVDLFGGTGALTSHTADTGGTWAHETYFSVANTYTQTLAGGELTTDQTTNAPHLVNPATPPSADYYAELTMTVTDAESYQYARVVARVNGAGAGTSLYSADLHFRGATSFIELERSGGTGSFNEFSPDFTVSGAGPHVLRIEVEGDEIRGYYNDTLMVSGTDTNPIAVAGVAGMGFQGYSGGNVITGTEFYAGTDFLTPPAPAPEFWTGFINSSETP